MIAGFLAQIWKYVIYATSVYQFIFSITHFIPKKLHAAVVSQETVMAEILTTLQFHNILQVCGGMDLKDT